MVNPWCLLNDHSSSYNELSGPDRRRLKAEGGDDNDEDNDDDSWEPPDKEEQAEEEQAPQETQVDTNVSKRLNYWLRYRYNYKWVTLTELSTKSGTSMHKCQQTIIHCAKRTGEHRFEYRCGEDPDDVGSTQVCATFPSSSQPEPHEDLLPEPQEEEWPQEDWPPEPQPLAQPLPKEGKAKKSQGDWPLKHVWLQELEREGEALQKVLEQKVLEREGEALQKELERQELEREGEALQKVLEQNVLEREGEALQKLLEQKRRCR